VNAVGSASMETDGKHSNKEKRDGVWKSVRDFVCGTSPEPWTVNTIYKRKYC
jgi:hypothetical protein